ncbi:hypothetical protein ACOMHN_062792 [Nucella lapillus]
MSTMEQELEEGEITDSDSIGEEQKPVEKPPAQHYSMFDNHQSRTAPPARSIPRPPRSDSSDNSSDDDDSDCSDDDTTKKRKVLGTNDNRAKAFVNPNFVKNSGKMPPMPKQSNKTIWGSILQEQILTAEVGSFSMEKPLPSDRDVESYDYSRAKDDDRPHPVEDDLKGGEEDLFGEVIDLEKAAFKQRRHLKRKHVAERLGKRPHVKERHSLPKVTESSPLEEVAYFISNELQEAKVHLIRRVVQGVGRAKALDLLRETEKVQAGGGMLIMNGSRRRTPGGVYLTLLKTDKDISKQQLDEVFEEENRWNTDMRKRNKARARRRRKEQSDVQRPSNSPTATENGGGNKPSSMEGVESKDSKTTQQTSRDRSNPAPVSDSRDPRDQNSDESDSVSEDDASEPEDFDSQLADQLQRQAEAKKVKEPSADGDADAITLDDVLDIDVEDDFLD